MTNKIKDTWDKHWLNLAEKKSFFGKLCKLSRKYIEANAVIRYLEMYFKKSGFFVECVCGTSQASRKLSKNNRFFVALDISHIAIIHARRVLQINCCVNGDIIKLPFKNCSIDGIWNLGVMEHFYLPDIYAILDEMHMVLKNRGCLILFWPHILSPLAMLLHTIEFFVNRFFNKDFKFYPEEPTRLRSKGEAKEILSKTKFSEWELYLSHRDVFNSLIVVCRK